MLEPDFQANQAEWTHLQESDPRFCPLARELPCWVRDFPFFFSHEELCFSHCPGYPFSRAGLPEVVSQGDGYIVDGDWFGSAALAAARLADLLRDQHQHIFSGNLDHKAYAYLRQRLEPRLQGSCPTDQPPWFEHEHRKCRLAWLDPQVELEFWEADQLKESGVYSLDQAVSKVQSWLG
ncbi:hypothetical protein JST97_03460 [bacterium]|nr:hypothetical protein [bacterium]